VLLAVSGLLLVLAPVVAGSSGPAGGLSLSTTGVNSYFAAATPYEVYYQPEGYGPGFQLWNFTAVTLGPSPVAGTLSINYCIGESCDQAGSSSFTLTSGANSLSGLAYGSTLDTLVGTVQAGAGNYAGLVGHAVTLTLPVDPGLYPLSLVDDYLLSRSSSGNPGLAPGVIVGNLSVAS
jgi:hypothetical protein